MSGPQRIWLAAILIALLAAVALRLHNASVWNPYWGYDGGAHLKYLEILASGRLPSQTETYVGWHEPLFYFLALPVVWLKGSPDTALRALEGLPAAIGILSLVMLSWWTWKRTRRFETVTVVLLLAGFLPVLIAASTFFSNEGLVQLLMLIGLFVLTTSPHPDSTRTASIAGFIFGLAILTKITALVAILAAIIWYGWRALQARSKSPLLALALIVSVSLGFSSPWLFHKARLYGGLFTNPFEAEYERVTLTPAFFRRFDSNIFFSPFWPAGSNSFWSVALAGTVTDYDALLVNPDRARLEDQQVSVGKGRTVSERHRQVAQAAVFLGAALAPLFALAGMSLVKRLLSRPQRLSGDALLALYVALSLLALAGNILRFGSIERGNLKSFFILSAVMIGVMLTAEFVTEPRGDRRLRYALIAYTMILGLAYAAVSFALTWV